MGLACCADIVIATQRARFALAETSLGIPPAQIAPYLVARLGERHVRRLALTGARIDGREAAAIGLADYYCETDEQRDATLATLLEQIGRCAPGANAVDQAADPGLARRRDAGLYRGRRTKLRGLSARRRGARGRRRLPRKARAELGGTEVDEFAVFERSDRQSRRDRVPHHPRRACRGLPRDRRLQRRRRRRAARAPRRRGGADRSRRARAILPVGRQRDRRREGDGRRGGASRLWLSRRERRFRAKLPRRRARLHRAAASGRCARWATRARPSCG